MPELTGLRIREVARQLGWADDAQFDGYEQAIRAWAEHPDAFMIWFDCEAIGWKS